MIDEVQALIARKNFPKAIEVVRAQAQAKPQNRRLRVRLCDLYQWSGRDQEAVPLLLTLADEFATDGFVAKAIAILKRIEKIESGRSDVESRLAQLIQDKSRRASSVIAPQPTAGTGSGLTFGLEVIDHGTEVQLGVFAADTASTADPAPAPAPSPSPAPTFDIPVLLAPAVDPAAATPAPAPTPSPDAVPDNEEFDASFLIIEDDDDAPSKPDLSTPLFDGLSPEELVAVMHGLELASFEPGDVIVGEGDIGDSMFILSSGKVKVYVRTPSGKTTKVDEFNEGDFFGEIAVLTGKPRTATLTAAEPSECLVLNRATLDQITEQHPRVTEVLKKFQEERALSTVNTIMAHRG